MPPVSSHSGILVLDKPCGITSMTAVSIVRRLAGGVKTGHAGTLDPLATGVLVIALGAATKCIDQLMATEKCYETVIDLTAFTATDDAEGERTEVAIHQPVDEVVVRAALSRFIGTIEQRPPAFSAVKVDGKRSYQRARSGDLERPASRPVRVHSIELVHYRWLRLELVIHSDKGFYVRSLARDLGEAMGTGGHCVSIRRREVGPFTLAMATTIERLPARIDREHLIAVDEALAMVQSDRTATEA
jgi:tRNA pseudouridine55 synthase